MAKDTGLLGMILVNFKHSNMANRIMHKALQFQKYIHPLPKRKLTETGG
jgi:hypothetical protein